MTEQAPSEPDWAFDVPLEPTLAQLIIKEYHGDADDAGRCHGTGTALFSDGQRYSGGFARGLMDGEGRYTWADGVVYEGTFVANRLTGRGKFAWTDGSSYEGEVEGGLRHGAGTFLSGDGATVYEGDWREGQRHGRGTLWYDAERTCFYEGEWAGNLREGRGTMTYPSGNVYAGEWLENEKHGEGTMQWFALNEHYAGAWRRGQQNGYGEHVWLEEHAPGLPGAHQLMCNAYRGEWRDGMRHGLGRFTYANGSVYDGEWQANAKHGFGTYILHDGRIYVGPFADDKMLAVPEGMALGSGSNVAPQTHLHLGDLLQGQLAECAAQTATIEKIVLRYTSELKALFAFFVDLDRSPADAAMAIPAGVALPRTLGIIPEPDPEAFTMPMHLFYRVALAVGLAGPSFSLVDMAAARAAMQRMLENRIFALHLQRGAEDRHSTAAVQRLVAHAAKQAAAPAPEQAGLLLREFTELLVRCAILRGRTCRRSILKDQLIMASDPKALEEAPARMVKDLMDRGIVPLACALGLTELGPPPPVTRSTKRGSKPTSRLSSRSQPATPRTTSRRSNRPWDTASSRDSVRAVDVKRPDMRWSAAWSVGDLLPSAPASPEDEPDDFESAAAVLLHEEVQEELWPLVAGRYGKGRSGGVFSGFDVLELLVDAGLVSDKRGAKGGPVSRKRFERLLGDIVRSFETLHIGARFAREVLGQDDGGVDPADPAEDAQLLAYAFFPEQVLEILAAFVAMLLNMRAAGALENAMDRLQGAAAEGPKGAFWKAFLKGEDKTAQSVTEALVERLLKPMLGAPVPPVPKARKRSTIMAPVLHPHVMD